MQHLAEEKAKVRVSHSRRCITHILERENDEATCGRYGCSTPLGGGSIAPRFVLFHEQGLPPPVRYLRYLGILQRIN